MSDVSKPAEGELKSLIEKLRGAPTAVISDNLERLQGANEILPYHAKGHMVGTAFTIKTSAGDNLAIHEALEQIKEGDVLVIDGDGYLGRALVGEIIVNIAKSKGAAGIVVDGAIRDVAAIKAGEFPCFAKGVNHKGPYKTGPGKFGVPVSVGGMVVNPGDIIVGDEDGLVVFAPEQAQFVIDAVAAQEAREAAILKSIAEGTYTGAYGATK